jgi:gluconate 2-dehydrogenase alpha chain
VTLFFEDKIFNPFMATGAFGIALDDFHANDRFDRGAMGAIGGATITVGPEQRPADWLSSRACGDATVGRGVEEGDGEMVSARHEHRRDGG